MQFNSKKKKSYDQKMGKEPWIDIFPKKKYGFMKWPPGTRKCAQHH